MARRAEAGSAWTSRRVVTVAAMLLAAVVVAFAALVGFNERDARAALDHRFEVRATLTAGFADDFIADLAHRQQAQAGRLLAEPNVDRATFEQVVTAFGFEAAVLLDGEGRVLQVWPARRDLIGQDVTADYDHLRTAVAGRIGVSNVVPSAATGGAITAVAVPFATTSGRRVFSGAFSPATAPIGTYLQSVVPVAGGHGFLIDADGNLLAGETPEGEATAVRQIDEGLTRLRLGGQSTTAVVAGVDGTPWRAVLTAPTSGLHAPVGGARGWAPRALVVALAAIAAATVALMVRLGRARTVASALSQTDELTQLPNRRAVAALLREAIDRSRREGDQLAVLMVDLDYFKSINDAHGHEVGDLVLQATADALRLATRDADVIGRWGGEEFLAVLSGTDRDGAHAAGERVRRAVAATALPADLGQRRVTASVGVAVLDATDPATLVTRADAALYRAKDLGRDRVVLDGEDGGRNRGATGQGDDHGGDGRTSLEVTSSPRRPAVESDHALAGSGGPVSGR